MREAQGFSTRRFANRPKYVVKNAIVTYRYSDHPAKVLAKISISQPVDKVLPKKDQPFLILWRDNFDSDVSIKLYDGNKLIQNISSRTASDGVYEWKPPISVKEGYFIRIFSWKDRNIFGQLQL